MDVFLVRHGESTANEIKEMAKAGEVIEVAYKRKIFAKDLYNGCNQTPLPYVKLTCAIFNKPLLLTLRACTLLIAPNFSKTPG